MDTICINSETTGGHSTTEETCRTQTESSTSNIQTSMNEQGKEASVVKAKMEYENAGYSEEIADKRIQLQCGKTMILQIGSKPEWTVQGGDPEGYESPEAVGTTGQSSDKCDKNSATNAKESDNEETDPDIDRGYAWVVLFASFFSNVIVDGVSYAVGIFYVAFLEAFEGDHAKTAWVGSVLIGVYLTIGEIVSCCTYKDGQRLYHF